MIKRPLSQMLSISLVALGLSVFWLSVFAHAQKAIGYPHKVDCYVSLDNEDPIAISLRFLRHQNKSELQTLKYIQKPGEPDTDFSVTYFNAGDGWKYQSAEIDELRIQHGFACESSEMLPKVIKF